VFGAIQYTVDYSVSGTISSQYRLAYAKHIETAAEYYAHLSSDNVDDKNAALTSLIARVFMTIYLVLDIVLRNMKNIQEAFF
jgi:Na+/proline symporter